MSGDSNGAFVPPTLAQFIMNSDVNNIFDFVEIKDVPEYNLLAKPKNNDSNQWLRLRVKHVELLRDSSDTSDILFLTLQNVPVEIVVVALYLSEVNRIFLFKDNDAPLNQPIILNMPEYNTSAIIDKLSEFYSNTLLITQE